MVWRKWNVILILLLANYIVFSLLAALVFPVAPISAPTHVVKPTFTPGARLLKQVDPLTYEFLTPSPSPTLTPRVTATRTLTATATLTATETITATETPTR
ncbi:MAG: hypothetical protein HZC40_20625 [Chloroflexi bacterium]|nr:hypothetical protein [Chloroflexota bacterium]